MKSPCLTCTRVRDPQNCENKLCKDWQAWFIRRWEDMRAGIREKMETQPVPVQGVPLGGRHYIPPHRLQTYLSTDPCETCLCPKDQCHIPCPTKAIWQEEKELVNP